MAKRSPLSLAWRRWWVRIFATGFRAPVSWPAVGPAAAAAAADVPAAPGPLP